MQDTSKALAIINQHKANGLVYFRPEDVETVQTFRAELTVLEARQDEFHEMKGGKYMPNSAVTNRIGDCSGVTFIAENCGVRTEQREDFLGKRTVHIGFAQGKRRDKDGSWRCSQIETYELDPILRAEEEMGEKPEYKNEAARKRKILEWMKFAAQRASTGARLRVIRALTGIPVAFSREQMTKPMVFGRYVQNTDFIMSTPEGKRLAIAQALGATDQLFGPNVRNVTPERQALPTAEVIPNEETQASGELVATVEPADNADPFADYAQADKDAAERVEIFSKLEEYLQAGFLKENGKAAISSALSRGEQDLAVLRDLLAKAEEAYKKRAS